ncbi:restriction endonuclease subunit S [Campylobacter upsaliensis]|uniref:restriction endonuclease subunit S n=1 Tax=Campylobacter upsaliensis TaxID=28080 RepID=UPI00214A7627|nr:restriction endonuclease subunit S [Campylobacter upsaliensis]MCR2109279.1 restriction endonuclease subunit S [Campylobacter upsaliensis]MCR2112729.1 restriction endonuclease subunit S [Campylobacter upsaliensis]MCR2123477.1 restriction endonuclease subunit S [Campylobacter upsaliensis]
MKTLNDNTHPLESLLQQHCPNGVEFKELGELWEKAPKSKMGANQAKNLSKNNGNICFTSGETHYFIDDYLVDGEFLFLNDGGTADIKYNSGKAYYTDHIFAFTSQKICVKFLYYFLKDKQEAINKTCFQGTGLKNLQKNKIEKFPIPLPPLEIQYKIVEILDAFTELEAELEAELETRLKQYEYYRNFLLSYDELENRTAKLNEILKFKTLGELGIRNAGTKITAHQMQALHKENAPIRIFAGGSTIADVDYRDLPKKDVIDKPSIICKVRGYIGFEYYDKPFSHKSEFWSYTIEKNANQKFIYYFLVNQQEYFQQIAKANSVKIPQLKVKNTDNFQIPLPPLAVQNEIVEILDKFDTLTNDLTNGIPAEIEARKKQYEYYRERLLSFIAKD